MFAGLTAGDVKRSDNTVSAILPLAEIGYGIDGCILSSDGMVSGANTIAHLKLGLGEGLLTSPGGVISCAGGLMMRRNRKKCIGVVIRPEDIG